MNVSFVYLPVGIYYVSFQNRLCKIKYGFQGSISNVDLHISSTPNLNLLRVLVQDLLIQFPKTFLEFPKTRTLLGVIRRCYVQCIYIKKN